MSLLCPNNHPNREGARFCQTCGLAVRQPVPLRSPAQVSIPHRAEPQGRFPAQAAGYGAGSAAALGPPHIAPAQVPEYVPRSTSGSSTRGGLATLIPLVLVFGGGLAVLAGFFMPWLAFSLPAVSFILGPSNPMTISGDNLR
jgi:hypothetical protein